jgi:heat-inducible transcriptional repressor
MAGRAFQFSIVQKTRMAAPSSGFQELTSRESEVLQLIIRQFIISASPVGSKTLVTKQGLPVSSATIRNAMHALEEKGYVQHTHTSSGRIPTELGYRYYVNTILQQKSELDEHTHALLNELPANLVTDMDAGLKSVARTVARITNLLTVIIAPKLADNVLRRLEMIHLGGHHVLLVLNLMSAPARTFTVEVENEISSEPLEKLVPLLNERLSGLQLSHISSAIREMLADFQSVDETGLIRVFVDSADMIFDDHHLRRFHFGGVEYMAMQPEFSDLKQYRSIVELVENENLIIHLLERNVNPASVHIAIGSENPLVQASQCSVVSAEFTMGRSRGTLGLVGPTRMDYPRLVALVEQVTARISRKDLT